MLNIITGKNDNEQKNNLFKENKKNKDPSEISMILNIKKYIKSFKTKAVKRKIKRHNVKYHKYAKDELKKINTNKLDNNKLYTNKIYTNKLENTINNIEDKQNI